MTATWLFTPGDGRTPPELAGRKREQAVLSRCLAGLTDSDSPPHNVVLIGPRGNGKTALLAWFEGMFHASAAQDVARGDGKTALLAWFRRLFRTGAAPPAVVAITAADVPNRAALRAQLAPTIFARFLPRKIGISGLGSAEWAMSDAPDSLARRLITRCRRRPLAVLLDEAHTLDLEVGQLLLNVSQQVRAKAPFLLVLAGTPGLATHLGKMDASFWDRLGNGLLGIGRLSACAAKTALKKPIVGEGGSIDEDALDMVVEHSQCYAYFLQLWGDALWSQRPATDKPRVTAAHAKAALPDFRAQMTDYYQRRYRELEAEGLLRSAVAVASAFRDRDDAVASDADVDAALAAGGIKASRRLEVREELNRLGYIWCPPGQLPPVVWHTGIPSLMRYVLERATQSASGS